MVIGSVTCRQGTPIGIVCQFPSTVVGRLERLEVPRMQTAEEVSAGLEHLEEEKKTEFHRWEKYFYNSSVMANTFTAGDDSGGGCVVVGLFRN